jgi:predicted DNA binding CopG/RHH family protein
MSKGKQLPDFKSEAEERAFWEDPNNNALDFTDPETERRYEDHSRPPTRSISLRLPVPLLEELKQLAGNLDVPYQSLMKVYLGERVDAELGRGKFAPKANRAAATKTVKPRYGNFINPLDPAMSVHAGRPKTKKRKAG